MATTHDTATRIALANFDLAGLELGSVYPAARALIYSADNTVLATFVLGQPAFPPALTVDVSANVVANVLGATSGDPDHFALTDRNGIARLFGGIGLAGSGADMEVAEDPLRPGVVSPVVAGQTVILGNLVYRAPP